MKHSIADNTCYAAVCWRMLTSWLVRMHEYAKQSLADKTWSDASALLLPYDCFTNAWIYETESCRQHVERCGFGLPSSGQRGQPRRRRFRVSSRRQTPTPHNIVSNFLLMQQNIVSPKQQQPSSSTDRFSYFLQFAPPASKTLKHFQGWSSGSPAI